MNTRHWYAWEGEDLLLRVKVQPRASRDAFAEPLDDCLKIRITAPPVDGEANAQLIRWLSKQFGVARSSVTILSGRTGPHKRIRIAAPERLPTIFQYRQD